MKTITYLYLILMAIGIASWVFSSVASFFFFILWIAVFLGFTFLFEWVLNRGKKNLEK